MGKLANVIWAEDWDVESFLNNSTKMAFGKVIYDMYDPNLEAQIFFSTCRAHIDGASIQLDCT
jgi:hypothetical protein